MNLLRIVGHLAIVSAAGIIGFVFYNLAYDYLFRFPEEKAQATAPVIVTVVCAILVVRSVFILLKEVTNSGGQNHHPR